MVQSIKAEFELRYKNMAVGNLILDKGHWTFEYSCSFKNQIQLKPIVDFPNLTKTYTSKLLWPFFSHRIPGLNQPMIQRIISDEKLNPTTEAELLIRFGRKSITNPYLLVVTNYMLTVK